MPLCRILSGDLAAKPDAVRFDATLFEDASFLHENAANQLNLAAYSVVKTAALCHLQDFE